MDTKTIKNMGRKLATFLVEFDDCFSRTDQRAHLQTYVNGQLSDLERKSIEPIALAANVPPRTLQYFLSTAPWDGPGVAFSGSNGLLLQSGGVDRLLSTSQSTGTEIPSQEDAPQVAKIGHKSQSIELLYST